MEIEQNVASRKRRVPEPLQHRADGRCPHCRTRLVNGGERHRKKTGVLDVVDSRQPDPARHAHTELVERLEEMPCGEIVGANDTVGTMLRAVPFSTCVRSSGSIRLTLGSRPRSAVREASRYPAIRASTVGAEPGRPTNIGRRQQPRADQVGRDDVAGSAGYRCRPDHSGFSPGTTPGRDREEPRESRPDPAPPRSLRLIASLLRGQFQRSEEHAGHLLGH